MSGDLAWRAGARTRARTLGWTAGVLGAALAFGCSAAAPDDEGGDGSATGGATSGTGGDSTGNTGGSQPGIGGTATSGGAPGSGGTSGGLDGCAAAVLCDDFEGGMDPSWEVQPNSMPAPVVDTTIGANDSSSSLVVEGTSQQSFIALPVPAQSFWTRAYVRFEKGTSEMTGHTWYIVGADSLSQGGGAQMRMGSSGNHPSGVQIDFNVYGGGCAGEKTQFSSGASDGGNNLWNNTPYPIVNFAKETWYCVEAHFDGDNDEFHFYVDDAEVPGLHVTTETMCADWSPTYQYVKFGAGSNSSVGKVWYDDVGVSTTRIGCAP